MTYTSPDARSAPGRGWRLAAFALAIIIFLFAVPLVIGGVYLISLGGSWYYALAGAGLVATAVLLGRQRMAALRLYFVVWLLTVIWAFWEVGLDWWDQVPRLVAPSVVLILILIVTPALRRTKA